MAAYGSIILCLLIFLLSYHKTKCFIHPSVLVSGVWSVLLILYSTSQNILYPLSERFYYVLCVWIILFCSAALFPHGKILKFPGWLTVNAPKVWIIRPFIYVFFVINIWGTYKLYSIDGGMAYSALTEMNENADLPMELKIFQYLQIISVIIYAVCIVNYEKVVSIKGGVNKYLFYLFIISLLCWSFVGGNKTSLIRFVMISLIALFYRNKLKIKQSIFFILVSILGVLSMQMLRSERTAEDFDTEKFAVLYTLSPLTAFDSQIHHEVEFKPNKTFRFFDNILYRVGLKHGQNIPDDEWVYVPIPTNVYTVMHSFYADFGYWGVIMFAIILGLFWGILYMGIQYKIAFLATLYATFAHTLVLQFFADYIFTFLSTTLQIFLILYILFVRHKISESSVNNINI